MEEHIYFAWNLQFSAIRTISTLQFLSPRGAYYPRRNDDHPYLKCAVLSLPFSHSLLQVDMGFKEFSMFPMLGGVLSMLGEDGTYSVFPVLYLRESQEAR